MVRTRLHQLLESYGNKYHIEYNEFLTNHTAHALVALHQLGASDTRLEEYAEDYSKTLVPAVPSIHPITSENYQLYKGQTKYSHPSLWEDLDEFRAVYLPQNDWTSYRDFFLSELENNPLRDVLLKYYPSLHDGMGGAALHCLIQLGWGLESGSNFAIAEGLAYHAFAPLSLRHNHSGGEGGENTQKPAYSSLSELLMAYCTVDPSVFPSPGFQPRMKHISTTPSLLQRVHSSALFWRSVSTHDVRGLSPELTASNEEILSILDAMQELLLALHLSAGSLDFFAVHLLTGLHSIRQILAPLSSSEDVHFEEAQELSFEILETFWLVITASYMARGSPKIHAVESIISSRKDEKLTSEEDWKTLAEWALPKEDEHMIKLAWTLTSLVRTKESQNLSPNTVSLAEIAAHDLLHSERWII